MQAYLKIHLQKLKVCCERSVSIQMSPYIVVRFMTPGSLFDFYLKFCFSVSKKELCIYFVLLNGLLEYSKPSCKNSV